jgi:DNA adenine methylase
LKVNTLKLAEKDLRILTKDKQLWVIILALNSKVSRPVIKWSGSKRLQAIKIVRLFPKFDTYYEPFVGGGAVLFQAGPNKAICGDICKPLIEFWQLLQKQPRDLIDDYTENWTRLQKEGYTYYYTVRDHFNKEPNPYDLLFLSRTCVNGLIRFNRYGEFNNSLHHTRRGINPATLARIILAWSSKVKIVKFVYGDYRETMKSVSQKDFVYLDPPYFNTKGRYYGRIDFDEFLNFISFLNKKGVKYALSFDGTRGDLEYLVNIPKSLYKQHFLLDSGNSTFRKVMNNSVEKVKESLYLNYEIGPEEDVPLASYLTETGLRNSSSSGARSDPSNFSE